MKYLSDPLYYVTDMCVNILVDNFYHLSSRLLRKEGFSINRKAKKWIREIKLSNELIGLKIVKI